MEKSNKLKCKNETQFVIGECKSEFTKVYNNIVGDRRLSDKGRGFFTRILQWQNYPGYVLYLSDLITEKDKAASIRSSVNELICLGYLQRTEIRNELGQFKGHSYTVYMEPIEPDAETVETIKSRKEKERLRSAEKNAKRKAAVQAQKEVDSKFEEEVAQTLENAGANTTKDSNTQPKCGNPTSDNPTLKKKLKNLKETRYNSSSKREEEAIQLQGLCSEYGYKITLPLIKRLLKAYSFDAIKRALTTAVSTNTFINGQVGNPAGYLTSILNDLPKTKTVTFTVQGKQKVNSFNNFPQRKYSKEEFDEIERKLLERSGLVAMDSDMDDDEFVKGLIGHTIA